MPCRYDIANACAVVAEREITYFNAEILLNIPKFNN